MKVKWKSLALHAVALLVVTACGTKTEEVEVFTAPLTGGIDETIAQCVTVEEIAEFAQQNADKGVKYRVLNKQAKMVGIYGMSDEEIKAQFPKAKITKNIVYHNMVPSSIEAQSQVDMFSANKPFEGAAVPEYLPENKRAFHSYLEQVDKFDADDSVQGQDVVIAVIDTGVYYNHPHLSPNILVNSSDEHGSGANDVDDDGNGYADDYVGWDFVNGDPYPHDDQGHGTHVAGLAAGTQSGIAPQAKILPIKVLDYRGSGDLGSIAAGVLYAVQRGADVINMSLGGTGLENAISSLLSAVKIARENDTLIITAAGNGGNDGRGDCNDKLPVYPANIADASIVSVAAVDSDDTLTSYSNYGPQTVDIAAPGGGDLNGGLYSTSLGMCYSFCFNKKPYTTMSGTSMATPLVSGLAALIKSANPSLTMQEVKQIILDSGKDVDALRGRIATGKVINAASAVSMAN